MGSREKKTTTVTVGVTLTGDEAAVIKTAAAIATAITAVAPRKEQIAGLETLKRQVRTAKRKIAKRRQQS